MKELYDMTKLEPSPILTFDSHAVVPFPSKLHSVLESAQLEGFEDVVSWQPDGRSFKVHNPTRFSQEIMPLHFQKATKYKSFQRQLNIYGFRRIHAGPKKGGYSHRCFMRGAPEFCGLMIRRSSTSKRKNRSKKTKRENVAQATDNPCCLRGELTSTPVAHLHSYPSQDPSSLPSEWTENASKEPTQQNAAEYTNSQVPTTQFGSKLTENARLLGDSRGEKGEQMTVDGQGSHIPASEERITGSSLHPASSTADGDLGELLDILSNIPVVATPGSIPLAAYSSSESTGVSADDNLMHYEDTNQTFPHKLYRLLEDAESEKFDHIVSWFQNGVAFKIHNTKAFVEWVMPYYFDQTQYESFRRQLNLYGFSRLSRGTTSREYSHPSFVRGNKWLIRLICREPIKKSSSKRKKCPV